MGTIIEYKHIKYIFNMTKIVPIPICNKTGRICITML